MKISVVLCTYNGEKYIKDQLESILNQSVKIDEIIVSDDNSIDSTLQIINSILNGNSIKYTIVTNKGTKGVTNNFINALSYVSGDIIYFSDQDDIWVENKVELMNEIFEKYEKIKLVCSDAILINEKTQEIGKLFAANQFNLNQANSCQLERIIKEPFVTGATMAIRKSLYIDALPFSNSMLHDQWLSYIAACYNEIYVINEPLIYYRQHANNVVGAGKKKRIDKIICKNINQIYGEEQYNWFTDLYDYLLKKDVDDEKLEIVQNAVNFWHKRSQFYRMNIMQLKNTITKSVQEGEYEKYSLNMNVKYEVFKYLMQLKSKRKV